MLSFEQKIAICDSFPELERKNVSLGRVNYHYDRSVFEKKTVVYHLHPNGNGFVYVGELDGFETDDRGFVNVRDFDEAALRDIVAKAIQSLSGGAETESQSLAEAGSAAGGGTDERWKNAKGQALELKYEEEDGMWFVYAGLNLDGAFDTYEEAVAYLEDEGFTRT